LPTQSAGVSRKGNRIIQRLRKISEKKERLNTMGAKTQAFDIFPTPLISHYPLPLKENEQNLGLR
jgi:hypothetical protein